jgi:molybdopterin converting factor small subunit
VAHLRLFGPAREEAGTGGVEIPGHSVGAVLDEAGSRFGTGFTRIVDGSRIWVNGDAAGRDHPVGDRDEVAVIPPVSGG